ncbi:DUF4886 domain-containing protein [Aureispira anguillae]|uniref:PKD domain-containing protein n=1 Tax=Aureispira anguillae TaxID=2864201 RepID=A0A916DWI5_9BACT|nr:DUF4886 domain-containing protein [Aureispira anguillae]BDS14725.1 PKD domain-containing protein [Aureispira anguillae]
MMNKITFTFLFLVYSCAFLFGQETKRAFFIGNSYTYYNTLPALINSLANANGDTLIHASSTPGGAQLIQHINNTNTLNGIRQGNWDYVVIQEQSQKPSFSPSQVAVEVLPYAAQLDDSINFYNPCAETVFFMTWGRKNGDQSNCQFYPPICTYDGMQNRLRSSYLLMADQNEGICSPVGAAWKVARDSFPGIELYAPDGSHPSYAGSYLAACTFYATIFQKSPVGLAFYGSLTAGDAQILQNIAASVVLDSLPSWNIGDYDVVASFDTTIHLDSVQFYNNSTYSNNYYWNFGDSSAASMAANPSHIYDSAGTYLVTLIASDSCGNRDTTMQSVVINIITNVKKIKENKKNIFLYPNPASDCVTVASLKKIESIRIVNSFGGEVFYQKNMKSKKNVLYLKTYARGVYYVYIKLQNSKWILKKLVLQ